MLKILHVDDSLDDRVLTKIKLEKVSSDILIEGVEGVDEAFSALEWGEFDCILSDFQMPGQDGSYFLKSLRQKNINIPFIFYTGQGNENLAVEAFRAGADDYFTKDVGFAHYERLMNSIEKIVKYYKQFLARLEERSALRRSQNKLIKAQHLAKMSIWEWDFKTDKFYCSDEFFYILGIDPLLYQGDKSKILEQFPGGEQIRFKKDILSVMRGAEINQKEYVILDKKGQELAILVTMAPVFDEKTDIVTSVEGVVQDVTERKKVERQVETERERLSQAYKLGGLGSFEMDLQGKRVYVSDITRKIFELSDEEQEFTLDTFVNMAVSRDRRILKKAFIKLLRGQTSYNIQFEIEGRKKGQRKVIDSIGKIEFDKNGSPLRFLGTVQDITRLRNLNEQQEQQYKQLRKVLFDCNDPAAEISRKGEILKANPSFEEEFRSEGLSDFNIVFPGWKKPDFEVEENGHLSHIELRAYNGQEYALKIVRASVDFNNSLNYLISASELIPSKRTLSRAIEKELDFAALKDLLPVGLYRTSGDGEYIYANKTLAEILGCQNVRELKKQNALDFYLDSVERTKKLNEWIIRDEIVTVETKLKTRQGKVIWVQESGTVFLNNDGTIDHIVGMIQDITEQKNSKFVQATMYKIANEAHCSGDVYDLFVAIHRHLSKLIDTTNFYIALYEGDDNYFFPYVIDENDEILNERLKITKGMTSYIQKTGQPLLVDSDDVKKMIRQGKVEIVGTPAECWMGVPLFSEKDVLGVMAVQNYQNRNKFSKRDLDILTFISGQISHAIERKISEKKLISQRDELARTNKELEAFSYTVSHDLKAPLRHITGYSSLLRGCVQPKENSEEAKYFDSIKASAERMESLIRDILTLSSSSSLEINRQEINLSLIAMEIISSYSNVIKQRNIKVEISPGLQAYGDARMLRLVLENLIGNAIKFTEKGKEPSIEIGKKNIDQREVFYVKDNGAGFDEEKADSVFTAFKRLHSQKEFKGTGIGLATVKKVVTRHGGEVWAESKEDNGATIFFTIPSLMEQHLVTG